MFSTPSNTDKQAHSTQLLSIGQQCSHPFCSLVDFLPFKCQHCQKSFCQEHFKVDVHKCEAYDEMKHNRIAPNCPLCNTPVALKLGQDPNIRMDEHLERECPITTGKSPSAKSASSTPHCARPTCKKVLFSPIVCEKCNFQFCPAHRFPGDHDCKTQPIAQAPSSLLWKLDSRAKGLNSTIGSSITAARKPLSANSKLPPAQKVEAVASSSASPSAPPSSSSPPRKPKPTLPFNKTDRLSSFAASSQSTFISNVPSSTNTTTATSTTTNAINNNSTSTTNPPLINDPNNKPPPVIDTLSFIPRPLFASA